MSVDSPLATSPQMELPLTSSPAASRAKTFRLPAWESGLPASGPAYGTSLPDWLARYDRDSSSWKTRQRCFLEGWATFSETWPRSGIVVNGIAYRLAPLVP